MNLPSSQQGMGVTSIVLLLCMLILCFKIGMGIIPAQVGHYQIKKSLTWELKKANESKATEKQLFQNLSSQWSINSFSVNPNDVVKIIKNTPGDISVKLVYEEESSFFGNVFIVSRFEETITAEDAKLASQ